MNENNQYEEGQVSVAKTKRMVKLKETLSYKDIDKKYNIEKQMARGGMGIVHRIFDKELQRHLAMKVLLPSALETEIAIDKVTKLFLEEAQITAQLEHPNIVPVHDMGVDADNNIYFTMKIVTGDDMSKIIRRLNQKKVEYMLKYPVHKILPMFRKVCDAVDFAHSRGVIHRDIKPSNIMIGDYGEVILMDWGLAKFIGQDISEQTQETINKIYSQRIYDDFYHTDNGTIQGTPMYMSPEQAAGRTSDIDVTTDIYLLGGTLYHLIALQPPHEGKNALQILASIKRGVIIPPHERNPGRQIPEELSRIVLKAMAFKQEDRYQSVKELVNDLDILTSGHIVSTPLKFKAGEFLIRQGETGKEGYVITNGKVEIFKEINDKKVLLATMGPGDIVGEMALITSEPRSADVVASEDTLVSSFNEKQMNEALKRVPSWMQKVVVKLVERLRLSNKNVHPLLIDEPTYHVLKQLISLCSLSVCRKKANNIEELEINLTNITQDIGTLLCIDESKVKQVLDKLLQTELCNKIDEETFRICNFSIFCHVVDFLDKVFEINSSDCKETQRIDKKAKIKGFKLAARISNKAKQFLENIPLYAKMIEE